MKTGSQNGLPDGRVSDLSDDPVIGDLGAVGQGANVLGDLGAHLEPRLVEDAAGLATGAIASATGRDTRTQGKERPILFSGPMVRAILRQENPKTQTRREVKRTKHDAADADQYAPPTICCPYGQPGDRLWVRESWMDLQGTGCEHRDNQGKRQRYAYMADTPKGSYSDECRKDFGLKWKPSIHMPRAASRITLEITGVRVERLQDISEADAIAEGTGEPNGAVATVRDAYSYLWESINGPGAWDANPWVWVVEFRRLP